MDFEFTYDYREKRHGVLVLAEHRAIGMCLSQEYAADRANADGLEILLRQLELGQDSRIELTDWVIDIEDEEVLFRHNSLFTDGEAVFEQNMDSYLDWEISASCGKDDVIELIANWLDFILEHKR